MKIFPDTAEINSLFANSDAELAWSKASNIVGRINPVYDFTLARTVFDDVVRLFRGEYPGYCPIKTPYHDLPHTLDVFLCAVRLMHGVHASGTRLGDDEIALVMMATLMHDIGYAQKEGEGNGTGAQFTKCHVDRGIEFMLRYAAERNFQPSFTEKLECVIRSTDPGHPFAQIPFPDEHCRLLGQLVGTADLVGQMADRTYLEKLLFLYLEFKEANFGNYQSVHDMLRQTKRFYEITQEKLDSAYQGLYAKLVFHFREFFGTENNYYLESIEKNIAYLAKVTAREEAEHLVMLKRGGIAERSMAMAVPG
ncbi:MAG TPA: HD domain-containing protein [Gallionella sp.]|nr:HD domain-containing protein [Gallionella sp.]